MSDREGRVSHWGTEREIEAVTKDRGGMVTVCESKKGREIQKREKEAGYKRERLTEGHNMMNREWVHFRFSPKFSETSTISPNCWMGTAFYIKLSHLQPTPIPPGEKVEGCPEPTDVLYVPSHWLCLHAHNILGFALIPRKTIFQLSCLHSKWKGIFHKYFHLHAPMHTPMNIVTHVIFKPYGGIYFLSQLQ